MAGATTPAQSRHPMARAPRRLPAAIACPILPTTSSGRQPWFRALSESPSLHLAVDVHGATGCVSRLKTSGHVARASACDCRPSYVCRPRQPLWTYAKPLSAIRHRLPSCWRRMACRLEQSQTVIPGRSRAAAASMVAPQAAGWMYEAGKGLLQLYCVGWSTFASSAFGCAGMLFWWAPWHGGVAGIRQDRH